MTADGDFNCYVLVRDRSAQRVAGFLNEFLPMHREMADEYEVPQYSDAPARVFTKARELLDFLATQPAERHAIYWLSTVAGDPVCAMAFFTDDGAAIFGLAVGESDEAAQRQLAAMQQHLGSSDGVVWFERPPPLSGAQFLAELRGEPAKGSNE